MFLVVDAAVGDGLGVVEAVGFEARGQGLGEGDFADQSTFAVDAVAGVVLAAGEAFGGPVAVGAGGLFGEGAQAEQFVGA